MNGVYLLSSAVIVWAAGRYRRIVERLHSEMMEREKGQKNNARLAALVDQSPDAIVSLTPGMAIQTWNEGAERLFGYSAAEAIGYRPSILAPEEKQDEVREVLARLQKPFTSPKRANACRYQWRRPPSGRRAAGSSGFPRSSATSASASGIRSRCRS